MEKLDRHDGAILSLLGYAAARSQLFEFAMLKLLEVQRHDLSVPLDERWTEIERWLTTFTAGRMAKELRVPEALAADLRAVVDRRNVVTHHSYRFYVARREKVGDRAVEEYTDWFDEQAATLGYAYNGLMAIVSARRDDSATDDEAVLELWRESVPAPVEGMSIPGQAQA